MRSKWVWSTIVECSYVRYPWTRDFLWKIQFIFFPVVLTFIHDNDVKFPLLPTNSIMSPSKVIPYIIRELINLKLTNGSVLLKRNHFRKGMLLFSMFYDTDFTEWSEEKNFAKRRTVIIICWKYLNYFEYERGLMSAAEVWKMCDNCRLQQVYLNAHLNKFFSYFRVPFHLISLGINVDFCCR